MEVARDALAFRHQLQLLDVAPGARERERGRRVDREGLQQVDVVRLERLALARLRDQEHREHVALGVEREEERRAQPDVRIHPKRTWVGPEITDELCTSRASDAHDDRPGGCRGPHERPGAVADRGDRLEDAVGTRRPGRDERRPGYRAQPPDDQREQLDLGAVLQRGLVELPDRLEARPYVVVLRAIARHLGEAAQRAVGPPHRRDRRLGPEALPVRAPPPSFRLRPPIRRGAFEVPFGLAGRELLDDVEDREVTSEDVVFAPSLDPLGAAVPRHHPTGGIEHEDRVVADAFDEELEVLLRRREPVLDAPALRDVAHERHHAEIAFVVALVVEADVDREFLTVLPPPEQREGEAHRPARGMLGVRLAVVDVLAAVPLGHERFDRQTDQLIRCVAEDVGREQVRARDASCVVDHHDAVGSRAEDVDAGGKLVGCGALCRSHGDPSSPLGGRGGNRHR